MIVLVAGIPSEHFNRIQKLAPTIFGAKQVFLSTPLRGDADGLYRPDRKHAEALIGILTRRVQAEPKLSAHGCGIIILASPQVDVDEVVDLVKPFAAVRTGELPAAVAPRGREGEMTSNAIANTLRTLTPPLIRAVNAMNVELSTRLNRTPLLLPVRNFKGRIVEETIQDLSLTVALVDHPVSAISRACKVIEARYPFAKVAGGQRRCFTDDRKIQYRLPARAHHGMAVSSDPPHNDRCYLNGRFRLGGCYEPGFHYDCIKDYSDGQRKHERPLKARFVDCHESADRYDGKPNVNVATNDYIRV